MIITKKILFQELKYQQLNRQTTHPLRKGMLNGN
jgi:hypothetical protein